MPYQTEFNASDYLIPSFVFNKPWIDHSYHNDLCPSFFQPELRVVVWVHPTDVAKREFDECPRLILQESDEEGTGDGPDLYEGNSVDELLEAIKDREVTMAKTQDEDDEEDKEILELVQALRR